MVKIGSALALFEANIEKNKEYGGSSSDIFLANLSGTLKSKQANTNFRANRSALSKRLNGCHNPSMRPSHFRGYSFEDDEPRTPPNTQVVCFRPDRPSGFRGESFAESEKPSIGNVLTSLETADYEKGECTHNFKEVRPGTSVGEDNVDLGSMTVEDESVGSSSPSVDTGTSIIPTSDADHEDSTSTEQTDDLSMTDVESLIHSTTPENENCVDAEEVDALLDSLNLDSTYLSEDDDSDSESVECSSIVSDVEAEAIQSAKPIALDNNAMNASYDLQRKTMLERNRRASRLQLGEKLNALSPSESEESTTPKAKSRSNVTPLSPGVYPETPNLQGGTLKAIESDEPSPTGVAEYRPSIIGNSGFKKKDRNGSLPTSFEEDSSFLPSFEEQHKAMIARSPRKDVVIKTPVKLKDRMKAFQQGIDLPQFSSL